jgi:hypothetical protein
MDRLRNTAYSNIFLVVINFVGTRYRYRTHLSYRKYWYQYGNLLPFLSSALVIAESSKEVGYGEETVQQSINNLPKLNLLILFLYLTPTNILFFSLAPWLLQRAARKWAMERRRYSNQSTTYKWAMERRRYSNHLTAYLTYFIFPLAPWLLRRAARRWAMGRRRYSNQPIIYPTPTRPPALGMPHCTLMVAFQALRFQKCKTFSYF